MFTFVGYLFVICRSTFTPLEFVEWQEQARTIKGGSRVARSRVVVVGGRIRMMSKTIIYETEH